MQGSPADDAPSTVIGPSATPLHPDTIGPYRVLSLLGEGGMGEVYLAEQQTPRRRVAVKVVKAGMDTRQVVARFEAERQTLALMDHPNIATVFDAGVTAEGRPYFAMEYVAGIPITDYCDRHQLSTTARLLLFLDVCGAIHHAHQKGVIHRDVKPSNVLVTVASGTPVPKVIDFGVAKATNQRLTEKTIFTELGLLVGTPEYMSPEQAEMTGLDVDTTTDIYSLGVLLYELLAGALPFDSARLRRGGYAEIQRIIREEEPARPSTRVSTLGETAQSVARHRGTDLPSLARELRGDLDWITLKAMEKDRTRRYASASEFAADLRRHLADEPVVARRAGVGYRGWKFVRRHRAGVAVGAAALVLIVAAGVMTVVQARRIAAERDLATHESERAKAVTSFLVSLFDASDPDRSKGEIVNARQLLDDGRKRLQLELADQPQTRAALLHSIGSVYGKLDLLDQAESALTEAVELRRQAIGRDRADLAESMNELSLLLVRRGQRERAEQLASEVLRLRRAVFGPEHIKVAQSISNLGGVAFYRGQFEQAAQLYRDAGDMAERVAGPDEAASSRANHASMLIELGRLTEAIDVFQKVIPTIQKKFGAEHTRTQALLNNLGGALNRAGRFVEAERTHREILRVRRKLLGPTHFDVAVSLYNLGWALGGQKRFDEAERMYEESVAIHQARGEGPEAQHAWALSGLASVRNSLGKYDLAERGYREAIGMFERAGNAPPAAAAFSWDDLGRLYYSQSRFAEAETALRRALAVRKAAGEKPWHGLAQSMELLAQVLCERGGSEEGERLAREALEIRRGDTSTAPAALAFTESALGRCRAPQKLPR